jgi:DNA-binding transcriptional MocR family regulator
VSPATVAAAYRTLKQRALVSANRRSGTVVAPQPPLRVRAARALPRDVRDLSGGNPDPALLPPLRPALDAVADEHKLYGGPVKLPALLDLAAADFARDEIGAGGGPDEIAIAGGALDAIERVLQTQLRAGDRVAVEDPSWPRIHDLVRALGLQLEPVAIDQRGLVPGALEAALARGVRALIATPRGQNPTGASLDGARAADLRGALAAHPDVLVIEDDYLAALAGSPYHPLHEGRGRWVVIRSLSKVLGPDLRVAPLAGDPLTIARVEGRQLLGPGWVSHLLQQTAAAAWAGATDLLKRADGIYARRRAALVEALAGHGITSFGATGLGVWVPLAEEAATVAALLERGWAVSSGERFRLRSPPGIRITTTSLQPEAAHRLAADLHAITRTPATTYTG